MNRYEVTKALGDGSYGSVLRARNKTNGELVAIKKMKQKYHSWEECMKLREINSLRKLVHPHIVKLKEVIRENDELHLVFEFCEANMYEYMKAQVSKGRSLPESKICSFMFQTMQAVQHVHKHGYFHRDLKPDNLLVSGEVVKLADFGLAREIRARPPFTEYVSTRWYRAPELLLRSRCYNSPVDMWAVGAIMAELYAMRPLMPGTSEPDQLFKICSVLGTPTQAQWPEGHKLAGQMGFKFPQMTPTALEVLLPQGSPNGLCLAAELLQWDPGRRPNASKVLQHPFFEGCVQVVAQQLPAAGGTAESSCQRASDPDEAATTSTPRRLPKLRLSMTCGSFGADRGLEKAAPRQGQPASASARGSIFGQGLGPQKLRLGGSCAGLFLSEQPAASGAQAASQAASGAPSLPPLQRAAQAEGGRGAGATQDSSPTALSAPGTCARRATSRVCTRRRCQWRPCSRR
ncbi:unnamed protein product [Prorocentrum cordatum]|uniref:Protein kinase domain-containing protein n=1 Tax=Prorocentrum cordatum TaxID=2364126 RepID=A0ABN9Y0H2_9DINO|nr:unnamed protein product [Polarella glacialis]